MDLQALNVDLVQKLSLALVIIRHTPPGIPPEVFTRSLAKRLFPPLDRAAQLASLLDDQLFVRQQELLTRLLPAPSPLASSISFMDLSALPSVDRQSSNEYEFGDFAEKVCQLKDRHYRLKVPDIEFLLQMLSKWLMNIDIDNRAFTVDACLYTVQIIATKLQTDHHKPYHLVLDLLPLIDTFLDCLLDKIEQTAESNVSFLHQMILSLASTNTCISRILDKICTRLRQQCETIDDEYERQLALPIALIDPIDRLFNLLHDIVHNRSIFQCRLSQRSVDKLSTAMTSLFVQLDGKSNYRHLLKLEGQLQAGNYHRTDTSKKTFRSYTSSSSSEHSQCQVQKYSTGKALTSTRTSNLDYSISQHSQSQYF